MDGELKVSTDIRPCNRVGDHARDKLNLELYPGFIDS